ncbi:hypothetical protein QI633_25130 [Nocardioides sp. QY071]|uniref:hypothetical protein n=1 Tax=Nocardioides sp. QY071 TaxID=3044187 RepID=UPI00249C77FA|nr:hypothetical protein [Nocardioides sp. QY071]WGY01805.1 hypothetical protein QI633_25130 [Nocardioides sp. QY071]
MGRAEVRARETVALLCEDLESVGLVKACRDLFKTVWTINIARHEPDELGDTAMSLGLQTHQNFITRAERRHAHDEREAEESHWNIEGLSLTRSGNAFVMNFRGARISVLKVPYEHGRKLRPDQWGKWDGQSQLRSEMAANNSAALGGYRSILGVDDPLFEDAGPTFGPVRDYLLVLAGEPRSPLTSAWLGAPVVGDYPLIGAQQLWVDEEPEATPVAAVSLPEGLTRFDQLQVPEPAVTLRPKATEENHK